MHMRIWLELVRSCVAGRGLPTVFLHTNYGFGQIYHGKDGLPDCQHRKSREYQFLKANYVFIIQH